MTNLPPSDAPLDPPGYSARVRELEAEGLTTSDAQGIAEAEFRSHLLKEFPMRIIIQDKVIAALTTETLPDSIIIESGGTRTRYIQEQAASEPEQTEVPDEKDTPDEPPKSDQPPATDQPPAPILNNTPPKTDGQPIF